MKKKFELNKALQVLKNTPAVIETLFHDVNEDWINTNEGENTWTPKQVLAHLIICEITNWLPRAKIILSEKGEKSLPPMDMNAHFDLAQNQSTEKLLAFFQQIRKEALTEVDSLNITGEDLAKTASHPVIGTVNLQQLIATWVTHDLAHLVQITRTMARQNKEFVGGFGRYLNILNK